MATGEPVQVGEAVGIIAAQSIGEPGTQLTMRTFHNGGVAGGDITQGLPRVEELFEARKPKGIAIITEIAGTANLNDTKKKREIIVTNHETGESKAYLIPYGSRIKVTDGAELEAGDDITQGLPRVEELFEARKPKGLAIITEIPGVATINDTKKKREIIVNDPETGDSKTYLIPYGSRIKVLDGQVLEAGDELTEGSVNPHDILRIKGVRAVQDYMIREVQRVYRLQGVEINDKHIEVIVHQMLKKIRIEDNGDTEFLPGTLVDVLDVEEVNEKLEAEGKQPAEGKQVMLGITKASLATNSFLSAASFQETTKVLTEAAIKGKVDPLIGLKENVIIGKLIPAGTGMKRYSEISLDTGMPEVKTASEEPEDTEEISVEEEKTETAPEEETAAVEETAEETAPVEE